MEYQEKVAWLNRYRESLKREEILKKELEQAEKRDWMFRELLPEGETPADRLKKELKEEMERNSRIRREIAGVLEQVRVERQKELLYRRYILGRTFDKMGTEMMLDPRWCRRLHKAAVECLEL